jgi:hypothetical protein
MVLGVIVVTADDYPNTNMWADHLKGADFLILAMFPN